MEFTEKIIAFMTLSIVFSVLIFLAWYFSYRARHKEMLMMIEKGIEVQKLREKKGLQFPMAKIRNRFIGYQSRSDDDFSSREE